jgi:hypothetical protein
MWRGHRTADWSPVAFSTRSPSRIGPFGEIIEGTEYVQRAWRCALHDDPSRPWS